MTSVFDLHYPDQSSQVSNSDIRDQIKANWLESGVDPHLVDLNALPLGGADLFDFLYPNPKRINSGRLNDRYLKLWYKCEQAAGWLCNGRFRQTIGEPINVDKALHNGAMKSGEKRCSVQNVARLISVKTGNRKVSTHHICKKCRRQFFDTYSPPAGYPDEFKRECRANVRQWLRVSRN